MPDKHKTTTLANSTHKNKKKSNLMSEKIIRTDIICKSRQSSFEARNTRSQHNTVWKLIPSVYNTIAKYICISDIYNMMFQLSSVCNPNLDNLSGYVNFSKTAFEENSIIGQTKTENALHNTLGSRVTKHKKII